MINDVDIISYSEVEYPVRQVNIRIYGDILISTTLLNDALVNSSGAYVTEDAVRVDEAICYFVQPNEIYLEESELRNLLEHELDVESEIAL